MTTERLFVAAEIPRKIVEEIINRRDGVFGNSKIKWEPKEKLHLTLKFLGETDTAKIPGIKTAIEKAISGVDEVPTAFTRFGVFYRNGQPKILWAGFEATEELLNLHFKIEKELENLGFERERRKYKPHLTLSRLKGYEDINKIRELGKLEFEKKDFNIDKIILFKSELKPTGSVYYKIESFELKNQEE